MSLLECIEIIVFDDASTRLEFGLHLVRRVSLLEGCPASRDIFVSSPIIRASGGEERDIGLRSSGGGQSRGLRTRDTEH